jgi:voltage-gated potassium channel
VFSAADVLHSIGGLEPYGKALHAAALACITGEPTTSTTGVGQVLDVALAVYAVGFFAALAGIFGAYLLESRRQSA